MTSGKYDYPEFYAVYQADSGQLVAMCEHCGRKWRAQIPLSGPNRQFLEEHTRGHSDQVVELGLPVGNEDDPF